ncbi:MAG: ligand-binding sensor domain-containing protein [Bacteroidia bacterium]|jgi:ligand-binding sensor domain-containing protein
MALSLACQAQQPYFQKIETVTGLASDKVYCAFQDSEGDVWFGTDAGVSLFDGYTISNFDNRRDLTANEVFEIYEDSKHRLWFLSQNGELSYYLDGELYNALKNDALAEIHINSAITSVCESKNGDIIFSSIGNGIFRLDTNFNAEQIWVPSAYSVWENSENKLFAVGVKGIYQIEDTIATLIAPLETDGHYARTSIYKDTCFIALGDELYAYSNGLQFLGNLPDNVEATYISKKANAFDIGTRTGAYVGYTIGDNASKHRYLDGSVVSAILKDKEGNLWISTVGDGIYFSSSPDVSIYNTTSGLAVDQVTMLHKTTDDQIWLGYRNGSYGIKDGNSIENDPIITPTNEPVTMIKTDGQGGHFVMSKYVVTWIDSKNRKRYLKILLNDLWFDSEYVYLASNRAYKIRKEDFFNAMGPKSNPGFLGPQLLENIVVPHRTKVVCMDSRGHMLFGTDKGLFLDNEGIKINLGSDIKGLNAYINDIVYDDKRGLTYVATRGEGIIVLRGTSEVKRYTAANNLSSNICVAFDLDKDGQLWIGTNQGLDLIENVLVDTTAIRFGANLGLRPTTIFDIVRTGNTLNLATNLGLMTYDLDMQMPVLFPDKPQFIGTFVNSKRMDISAPDVELKYNENNIRFDFIAKSFRQMGNVNYIYKLEGYQETWRFTNDRNIQYENLESGNYQFKIKAVHATGRESEALSLEFVILKPFWKLWWFQFLAVAAGVASFWIFLLVRLRVLSEKLTLENRLAEIKIDKLQLEKAYLISEQKAGVMQMNPHFLFNSLNTIKGYYGEGKMKEANGFIGKFAKLLRKILESNKPLIPLHDEAEILTLYLELMRNRYDHVFDYEIINLVDEHVNAQIPPMILQPIVENAVIHGLAPLNSGKITVTFEEFEGFLVCKVVDSGVGFSEEVQNQHNSVALENIRDRLDILSQQYNQTCSIKILSPINGSKTPGTAVIIKLPLNK